MSCTKSSGYNKIISIDICLDNDPTQLISKLFTAMSHVTKSNTLYIKEKWEREAGIKISEETWGNIWSFQWSTSNSMSWREHG